MADGLAEAINRLREELRQVVEAYNAAIEGGKVRAIRPAATEAHRALFAISQALRTLHPKTPSLL